MTQEATETAQPNTPDNNADGEIDRLKAELAQSHADMELISNSMLAMIPDGLKALIPDDLGPVAKIKWFNKAKETGIFRKTVPETDTRKPGITPQQVSPDELPPIARMSYGYSK